MLGHQAPIIGGNDDIWQAVTQEVYTLAGQRGNTYQVVLCAEAMLSLGDCLSASHWLQRDSRLYAHEAHQLQVSEPGCMVSPGDCASAGCGRCDAALHAHVSDILEQGQHVKQKPRCCHLHGAVVQLAGTCRTACQV